MTKLIGGLNFWLQNRSGDEKKTETVMRSAIAELLGFACNLEYILRLTKLKYTDIFIDYFHGSTIYHMKEKIKFLLWNGFAVLNLI